MPNPTAVAAAQAIAQRAAANITDPVEAAKAYRASLNTSGIHFGAADDITKAAFPAVNFDLVNKHKIGGFAKDVHVVGGAVGDVAKIAAPIAAMIPGVGLPLAAAISAGGTALGRLNDKNPDGSYKSFTVGSTVGDLAKGAGRAVVGHEAGVALKSAGVFGGGAAGAGAAGAGGPIAAAAGGAPAAVAAGGGNVLQQALDFVKKNPQVLLAGASAINNAKQGANANGLQNEALNIARDDYNSRAPLRALALQKLQAPTQAPRDLSSVYADPNNPYARR